MAVSDALSFQNEVFRCYITWGAVAIVKMLLMANLTSFWRFRKGTFSNPEDVELGVGTNNAVGTDENVERVRRAHLNDLENIPAFLIAGFFFVMSEPEPQLAQWLIRVGVISRIIHTFVHAIYPTQPARAIAYAITAAITYFMAIWSAVVFLKF